MGDVRAGARGVLSSSPWQEVSVGGGGVRSLEVMQEMSPLSASRRISSSAALFLAWRDSLAPELVWTVLAARGGAGGLPLAWTPGDRPCWMGCAFRPSRRLTVLTGEGGCETSDLTRTDWPP